MHTTMLKSWFKKPRRLLAALLVGSALTAQADGGMWMLKLMEQQHLADSLKKAGCLLSTDEIYSETAPSLRECVGIFGGGCTGEIVSADGLVFTNHHCGFSTVHEMSTTEDDIVKNGFFARSRAEERQTPNLTFTFVRAIADVTDEVNKAADEQGLDTYDRQTEDFLQPLSDTLLAQSQWKDVKGIEARVVPYFGGNSFYIFYEQTYEDVRLVVNPPYNVGQFGGNTDNWMWPRQNADFAVFRIYADKDGQPAPYSADNVPLKCKKFLPISLKGYNKGDFTMVMGFPGSTNRSLTAAGVAFRLGSLNTPIVAAGYPLLDFYKRLMDQSDENRLALEDEYFSLGNMTKNFDGMISSCQRVGLIDIKKAEENRVRAFAQASGHPEYADAIDKIDSLCTTYADASHDAILSIYTLGEIDARLTMLAASFAAAQTTKNKETSAEAFNTLVQHLRENYWDKAAFKLMRDKAELLAPIFATRHKLAECDEMFAQPDRTRQAIAYAFDNTVLTDSVAVAKLAKGKGYKKLLADPMVELSRAAFNVLTSGVPVLENYKQAVAPYTKTYTKALCEMSGNTLAPDANFTLRMTYGHVTDLKPRDAVQYDWRTVLDGMFEKESKTESDYFINEDLRRLYQAGDYGPYAREDGKLQTCFTSDNDITGGNSGSPVLNAKGELIGLAFDGNIESLASDLRFDPNLQRCINVDIRYVLFIIDKFGGSRYVIDELDLR